MGEEAVRREDALPAEQQAYEQLQFFTLSRGHPDFVHQHVVDAWVAQHADEDTKPMSITFALVGLYLRVERGFTGRYVQRVHMALARHGKQWPSFFLPEDRGAFTAVQVMEAHEGPERDQAIDDWCASVWKAYSGSQEAVAALLVEHGIL